MLRRFLQRPCFFLQLLFCQSFFAAQGQQVKVEGYAIMSSEYVTQFDGSYFTIQKKDGISIMDLTGKTIVGGLKAPQGGILVNYKIALYKSVFFSASGSDIVLTNLQGKPTGTTKYTEVTPFVTDNTVVRLKNATDPFLFAYIDTTGKEIVRFNARKYRSITEPSPKPGSVAFFALDELLPFSEGLSPIRSASTLQYGYINKNMQLAIPVSYETARPFSEGLAAVKNKDGYWGFIDSKAKLIIPYTYTYPPGRFSGGLAKVQNTKGKYGYINKEGKLVIAAQYAEATTFYKGYALANESYNQPPILIDSTGTTIATFPKNILYIDHAKPAPGISGEEYEYPFYISETLRELVDEGEGIFEQGLSYGLVDKKGRLLLDFKYKYLSDLHGGRMFGYIVNNGNHTTPYQIGIMNDKGEWIVQFVTPEF